jgi:hypothetical protein
VALLVCLLLTAGCRQTIPTEPPVRRANETGDTDVGGKEKSSGPGREEVALKSAELLVTLEPGTDPVRLARAYDLKWIRTLKADPDMHLLAATSVENARSAKDALARDPRVRRVYFNVPSQNQPFTR